MVTGGQAIRGTRVGSGPMGEMEREPALLDEEQLASSGRGRGSRLTGPG